MKLKKRSKRSRLRGAKTCGWGFRKKHKGSGHKGGKGMAGTGKRAKQKQQKALMIAKKAGFESYFGRRGLTSASTAKKQNKVINLQDIKENLFEKQGQKIELKEYKILGEGEGFKAVIEAKSASKNAIEKMEKEGGEIVLPVVKEKKVVAKKAGEQKIKKEEKPDKKKGEQ